MLKTGNQSNKTIKMDNLEFINTRFDPDITPFHDLAKQMAKAFGYTAELAFDKPLAQLIRLRVSQKNRCAYCAILHARTARDIGIDQTKIDNLGSYWDGKLYSEAEQAALAYCDALTDGDNHAFAPAHDHANKHFSEQQIAELAAIVIDMNLWTRLKLAQGAVPQQA